MTDVDRVPVTGLTGLAGFPGVGKTTLLNDVLTGWDLGGRGPAGRRPARGEGHDRHATSLTWATTGRPRRHRRRRRPHRRPALAVARRPWRAAARRHERPTPVAARAWTAAGESLVAGHADGQVELLGALDGN